MASAGQLLNTTDGDAEQVVASVLQLVVQHSTVGTDDVATWLQLSKAVRRALQQSKGRLCVGYGLWGMQNPVEYLTALSQWLPRHVGLLRELQLLGNERDGSFTEAWNAAEQVLCSGLQIASSCIVSSSSPQDSPLPALQLESFETNFIFQPAGLQSLAGSTCLTRLVLFDVPVQRFTAGLCSALGRLRTLRRFYVELQQEAPTDVAQHAVSVPAGFAAALAQLTRLESLDVVHAWIPSSELRHLPASLTGLQLQTGPAAELATAGATDIQLSHLSNLQALTLNSRSGLSAWSQLPGSLSRLALEGAGLAEGLPVLQQLHFLRLHEARSTLPLLQCLEQQPKLQRLELGLQFCSQQQRQQVADALKKCTTPTWLHLFNRHANLRFLEPGQRSPAESVDMSGVQLSLQGLRQLQRLKLTQVEVDFEGCSQLTQLTALTKLKMHSCTMYTLGLAVVLQRLTGLRNLCMRMTLPDNNLLLVSVAGMTNLQSLRILDGELGVSSSTLPLLSPLTKLTRLSLDKPTDRGEPAVSEADQQAFLTGMPDLARIDWHEIGDWDE